MRPMRSRAGFLVVLLLVAGEARAQPSAPAKGEKFALLVGVRQYETPDLRPLKYSEKDVEQLAAVLERSGYRRENIKLMTQTIGAENARYLPVAGKVRKELDLLLKHLGEGDCVVVALAGHGVQFQRDEEAYFCPADAQLGDKATLIPLGAIYDALKGCDAGFKLLLVDACRNNPLTELGRDAGRPVVDLPSLSRPLKAKPPGGVAALFSCSPGERAFELPELEHGVFFHYVIKALEGEADADADGSVDIAELTSFATRRVYRHVETKLGVEQNPEFLGKSNSVSIVELGGGGKLVTNSLGMKLVLIPAGEFLMGSSKDSDPDASPDELPQHRVRITKAFYLGATEVTQGQYRAVTGQSPSGFTGSEDLPVEKVSWRDAVDFCNKLSAKEGLAAYYRIEGGNVTIAGGEGYRLPTEAEWEYACRAGSTTRYGFGDDPAALGDYGWVNSNSDSKTHLVAQKRPNAFGLFDMHGNVWEWCWDIYGLYAAAPATDPSGPLQATARVVRGGCWYFEPRHARSAGRNWNAPEIRSDNLGFRVARVRSGG